jgi:hypothetical protein
MKKKENNQISSGNDLNLEKSKKPRAKSPLNLPKTRQNYLQNLEKQLDEIMTGGVEQKKNEKKTNNTQGMSGTTKPLQGVKSQATLLNKVIIQDFG